MQPVQNITVDDRVSRTQYHTPLEDPDPNELKRLGLIAWSLRLKQLPDLEDVRHRREPGGLRRLSRHRTAHPASRLGIAPTTIDNTLSTRPLASADQHHVHGQLNQYPRHSRKRAAVPVGPEHVEQALHPVQRLRRRRGSSASSTGNGSTPPPAQRPHHFPPFTPSANTLSTP